MLSDQIDGSGNITILRDATPIFTVAPTGANTYLITGLAGTEGAAYGTETISNIEGLTFHRGADGADNGSNLVEILSFRNYTDGNGTLNFVGSNRNDNINLSALVPTTNVNAGYASITNPYQGDDIFVGSSGNDQIFASAGADTISGGLGIDTLRLTIEDTIATSTLVLSIDANGDALFKDGSQLVLTFHRTADGKMLVTGSGMAAGIGTELLDGVEIFAFDYLTPATIVGNPPGMHTLGLDLASFTLVT